MTRREVPAADEEELSHGQSGPKGASAAQGGDFMGHILPQDISVQMVFCRWCLCNSFDGSNYAEQYLDLF